MPQKSNLKHLKISSLKTLTSSELNGALTYVEGIAMAAKNKVGHTYQECKKNEIESTRFEKNLKKLWDVFIEHDELSRAIEKEMDIRYKKKLGNKFGARTLLDIGYALDKEFDEIMKAKTPAPKPEDKKPKLQVK